MRFNQKILRIVLLTCLPMISCEVERKPMSSGIPEKIPIREYRDVPSVSLTNQEGNPFELADLKGKIWIANFIFTSCNAECVVLSYNMNRLQAEFAEDETIDFVSFSMDPQTDNPMRLKQYGMIQNADFEKWNFLTGDAGKIQKLVKESFLQAAAVTPEERAKLVSNKTKILHSNSFAIVDATGKVRAYVDGMGPDVLAQTKEVIATLRAE